MSHERQPLVEWVALGVEQEVFSLRPELRRVEADCTEKTTHVRLETKSPQLFLVYASRNAELAEDARQEARRQRGQGQNASPALFGWPHANRLIAASGDTTPFLDDHVEIKQLP